MCACDRETFQVDAPARGDAPRLIHRYEAIALASRCMLTAARRGDWDEVERLDSRCRLLIEQLKAAAAFEQLDVDQQRIRLRLLRDILADDAEVRMRTEPWLAQLEHLIAAGAPRRPAA